MDIGKLLLKYNQFYTDYIGRGGGGRLLTLLDLVMNFVVHGSTITDYFEYEFYAKKHIAKRGYVTWRRANRYFRILQNPGSVNQLKDKLEFYRNFDECLGRRWIYPKEATRTEFLEFIETDPVIIVKPRCGGCGQGVRRIRVQRDAVNSVYNELTENDSIAETCIRQVDIMNKFHPASVNTVRVYTVLTNSGVRIMAAAFKIGNGGAVIDNHAAGGILAAVDVESGLVYTTGIDKYSTRYIIHPMSGEQIVGFQIPMWDQVRQLVAQLANRVPDIRYVGWDVALTDHGPVVIEGNNRGMFDLQQQADQIGKRAIYDEVLAQCLSTCHVGSSAGGSLR